MALPDSVAVAYLFEWHMLAVATDNEKLGYQEEKGVVTKIQICEIIGLDWIGWHIQEGQDEQKKNIPYTKNTTSSVFSIDIKPRTITRK